MQNQVTDTQKRSATPQRLNEHNFISSLFHALEFPQHMEPKIEVSENKNNVMITAELPGVDEKDIDLEISANGYLTISGEKRNEQTTSTNGGYFSEISYGHVSRTIPLPWDIEYNKATANYNNGILSITLPKSNADKNKRQKINIKKTSTKKRNKAQNKKI
ncbi:MAG: Hsp20/alpha crystallin family protein [Alphaproteobacteria bacterium]|nr:Hsp20/alpha crystallin family protein [Alphaproteobacteria bacterium]